MAVRGRAAVRGRTAHPSRPPHPTTSLSTIELNTTVFVLPPPKRKTIVNFKTFGLGLYSNAGTMQEGGRRARRLSLHTPVPSHPAPPRSRRSSHHALHLMPHPVRLVLPRPIQYETRPSASLFVTRRSLHLLVRGKDAASASRPWRGCGLCASLPTTRPRPPPPRPRQDRGLRLHHPRAERGPPPLPRSPWRRPKWRPWQTGSWRRPRLGERARG